jgi:hypothetical protein
MLETGGLHPHVYHPTRSTVIVDAASRSLALEFREALGAVAPTKHLPPWALGLPPEMGQHLVEGLWKGDGCQAVNGGHADFRFRTASRALATQLWLMLQRYGFFPALNEERQSPRSFGAGNPTFQVQVRGDKARAFSEFIRWHRPIVGELDRHASWRSMQVVGNDIWLPIQTLSLEAYDGPVYNLEVDGVNSYSVGGISAHNCEGFGLVFAESMACGTPCITAKHGGQVDVVGSLGALCATREEYCDAIRETIKLLPLIGNGEVLRERIVRKFGIDRWVKAYLKLYVKCRREQDAGDWPMFPEAVFDPKPKEDSVVAAFLENARRTASYP